MKESYFLCLRTNFIKYFYDESIKPFAETKRLIEDAQPPFDDPPYSEDPEPPYLAEWLEAESGIEIVGLSCVSMLSESLKLHFEKMRKEVMLFTFSPHEKKAFKEAGYVFAYKQAFGEILNTDWTGCEADFGVIEQVLLARNRAQHGSDITSMRPTHDPLTMKKYPKPIFSEKHQIESMNGEFSWFSAPDVMVTRGTLFQAIDEIETVAKYIEANLHKMHDWRRKKENGRRPAEK